MDPWTLGRSSHWPFPTDDGRNVQRPLKLCIFHPAPIGGGMALYTVGAQSALHWGLMGPGKKQSGPSLCLLSLWFPHCSPWYTLSSLWPMKP